MKNATLRQLKVFETVARHLSFSRAAEELQKLPNRLPVYTSPLQRCRETAQPLADAWGTVPIVFPEIGEVPSPPLSLNDRQEWLRKGMDGDWAALQASAPAGSPDYGAWRAALLNALRGMAADAVVFSHFIAINVVIGAARNTEKVISFRPDHASITVIDAGKDGIAIKVLGREVGAGGTSVLLGR